MLSGGIDSTTLAYLAHSHNSKARAAFVNYGQKSAPNIRRIANWLTHDTQMPVEIINVPALIDNFVGFLGEGYDENLVMMCEADEKPEAVTAILMLAACWAANIGYDAVLTGYNKTDLDGDPDRYSTVPLVHKQLSQAFTTQLSKPFEISSPFWDYTKAEILGFAASASIPIDRTWSCWLSDPQHCGKCDGCMDRKDAFSSAKMTDPTVYKS